MKIAIPIDQKNLESKVCVSFGRAPYFLIYDTDSKSAEFINNDAAASAGGAGIKAAQTVVDSKASALLTPRCGENAAEVLLAAGVKLYKSIDVSVMENIEAFVAGKLASLEDIHAGFHGGGGN